MSAEQFVEPRVRGNSGWASIFAAAKCRGGRSSFQKLAAVLAEDRESRGSRPVRRRRIFELDRRMPHLVNKDIMIQIS